jgi:hypothetical protein
MGLHVLLQGEFYLYFNIKNLYVLLARCKFIYFSEQTQIISLNSINHLVFEMEAQCSLWGRNRISKHY